MARILLINGPNLGLLGTREPERYGRLTLAEIERDLVSIVQTSGHELLWFQHESEAALIKRVHHARDEQVVFIVINPGGLTHTSVALRDAIAAVAIPFIEVHLSNVHAREAFRRHSYFSDRAVGVIAGFGAQSYQLAIQAAISRLPREEEENDAIQTGI